MSAAAAKQLYDLMATGRTTDETLKVLSAAGPGSALYTQGINELAQIVEAIRQFGVPQSAFDVDLKVVRGLDYYTGTIYETTLTSAPELGSICSGGRYDDLASYFTGTKLPGVGISIGLTRLFSRLIEAKLLRPLERTPAEVLVTTMDARYLEKYLRIATELRAAGINTEVYLETAKIDKQLQYANRKESRVALIAGESEIGDGTVKIKNLSSREERAVALQDVVAAVKSALLHKES
jgi:histidyl-tRNA synthetase